MPGPGGRRRWISRILLAALVLGMAAGAWVGIADPFAPALPPGSNPAAYDALVRLGGEIRGMDRLLPGRRIEDLSADDLLAILGENAGRLDEAREQLRARPGMALVPGRQAFDRHIEETGNLRALGRLFVVAARRAEGEGRPDEAAREYLDLLELGSAIDRGGLWLDHQLAIAIEGQAGAGLAGLLDRLDTETLASVAESLRRFGAGRETIEQVDIRDRDYMRRTNPASVRVMMTLSPGSFQPALRAAKAAASTADQRARTYAALLETEVAIRRFRIMTGRSPERLDELVPGYLGDLPADPCGHGPLIYRREAGGHRLYSVGPDGADDGGRRLGKPGDWATRMGDAQLDDLK